MIRGLFEKCIDSPIFNTSSASASSGKKAIRSGALSTLFRLFPIKLIVNIHSSITTQNL
jgi:hypothetical protein